MPHSNQARTVKALQGSTFSLTDITGQATALDAFDDHEHVWLGRDESRGLTAIVAIHNTALGPALGGTRIWKYATFDDAMTDALRLSRGMTLKSAVAGMPFGGGKAVIWADPATEKTDALLEAYAEMLIALHGQFFTGEDVGLTLRDADLLRARTSNVSGTTLGGSGNPSPVTAHGIFLGIKAALRHKRGSDRLTGVRVAVQGLGSVGYALCEALAAEGTLLSVTDIDPARVERAKTRLGAQAVAPDSIVETEADIFAPCALGGILSAATIPTLKAGIVAGSANNQLALRTDARILMERGVLYAPDYVINAGGLINVAAELAPDGYDRAEAMIKIGKIPATLTGIFKRAEATGRPTSDVAEDMARERIEAARAS